jgi:hypothetical protein
MVSQGIIICLFIVIAAIRTLNLPSMMALVTINKHIIIPWLSTLNLPSMMADVTLNNHIIIP